MRRPPRLAYYVTPHGYGHAVRSAEVMRALRARVPDMALTVVTDLPDVLFDHIPGPRPTIRRLRPDVGLTQRDPLRFDLPATLAALDRLAADREDILAREAAFLRAEGMDAVVSDVAAMPFAAARAAGAPSVGIGNFTWDAIYAAYIEAYPAFSRHVARIREDQGACGLFLRLPMHLGCQGFARLVQAPFIARRSRLGREAARRRLGLAVDQRAVLVAFSDLVFHRSALKRLARLPDTMLLYRPPLSLPCPNALCPDSPDLAYPDLVAAADAVVTKPGYGIVTDCLAAGTGLVYCDRGHFVEYPILVEALGALLPAVYLPRADLVAGRWAGALERLWAAPWPPVPPDGPPNLGGADFCARAILDELDRA